MRSLRYPIAAPLFIVSIAITALVTITLSAPRVNGDENEIRSCVASSSGILRIIDDEGSCDVDESLLEWNKQEPAAPAYLICPACTVSDILARTETVDLADENFDYAVLNNSFLYDQDLSGSTFVHGVLSQLQAGIVGDHAAADFSDTNFTNANLTGSNLQGVDFTNANMTSVNMWITDVTGGLFVDTVFVNAYLQNVNWIDAELDDVDFTNADLKNSIGMDTATLTNITWDNTICPDGTNSDNNSNTCLGHLTL